MNKRVFAMPILTIFLCLLLTTGAMAADTAFNHCEVIAMPNSHIAVSESNDWDTARPVIVFFPGTAECTSIQETMAFVNKYGLYDNLDVNFLAACFRKGGFDDKGWKKISQDVLDYLKPLYEEKPFPIIVDGVSFGGYAASYMAQLFEDNGIPVTEINLADGCVPFLVDAEWLKELAGKGVHVNVWGCYTTAEISKRTRNVIETLDGIENFYGALVEANHAQVLDRAIREQGLHSAFSNQ